MGNQAIGMIETKGMAGLVTAGDAMCKAAPVQLVETVQIGGAYVTTIIEGEIGNVKAALDAGIKTLSSLGAEVIAAHMIPQPHAAVTGIVSKK
jgi:microcompartment protein CcmL/EutN